MGDPGLASAPPVKRAPTARDLERLALIKQELESDAASHDGAVQRHGEDDEEPVWSLKKAQLEKPSRQCPYLDTIDRYGEEKG